jgi:hypothetical protein
MAHTDNVDADLDLDMSKAREPAPPSDAQENRKLVFTSVWMVAVLVAVILGGVYLVISHHGHTKALTPGQPQNVASVILGGGGPSSGH